MQTLSMEDSKTILCSFKRPKNYDSSMQKLRQGQNSNMRKIKVSDIENDKLFKITLFLHTNGNRGICTSNISMQFHLNVWKINDFYQCCCNFAYFYS